MTTLGDIEKFGVRVINDVTLKKFKEDYEGE